MTMRKTLRMMPWILLVALTSGGATWAVGIRANADRISERAVEEPFLC